MVGNCWHGNVIDVDILLIYHCNTVDVVYSRGFNCREFKNLAKIIFTIALPKKTENLRILYFVKNIKIRNLRKFKHEKTPTERKNIYNGCKPIT